MATKAKATASDKNSDAVAADLETIDGEPKGYFGFSPDPTPRANYTIAGVLAGLPTPETDEQAKADALDPKKVR